MPICDDCGRAGLWEAGEDEAPRRELEERMTEEQMSALKDRVVDAILETVLEILAVESDR